MKFFIVFNWLPLKQIKHFLEDESATFSFDPFEIGIIYICVKYGKVNGSQDEFISITLSFITLHFFIKN